MVFFVERKFKLYFIADQLLVTTVIQSLLILRNDKTVEKAFLIMRIVSYKGVSYKEKGL